MTIMNSVELVMGLASILLASYSLLGFVRLAKYWYQISNLERYNELFSYIAVFVGALIGALILMILMVVN